MFSFSFFGRVHAFVYVQRYAKVCPELMFMTCTNVCLEQRDSPAVGFLKLMILCLNSRISINMLHYLRCRKTRKERMKDFCRMSVF